MSVDFVKLQDIFLASLDRRDLNDRRAYLDRVCTGDEEMRRQVEILLNAHREAGSIPGHGNENGITAAFDNSAEIPSKVIGSYKLLELIGEGGMGSVWMAQQTEPVKRLVALKIIKAGMDSRQVIARFEAERQALALMDHPNIARVFDGGCTPEGRPYFVMELVKGVSITNYCNEHQLTPRERLELFLPVCQAIQHAHQKGIIHRDLKPSNVLVAPFDGQPVAKVIDFGLAKATGQSLTDRTLVTGFGAIVGTLEYMSPEQAELNNRDIDTRSDIYSLGVLLYELLTGTTPLDRRQLQNAAFTEMLRLVREEEPPRPSTRLSDSSKSIPMISAQRRMDPAKLTKMVRGELDWIVMRCLEKDRSRRYETVVGLLKDVKRYLADEPVEARPQSFWYRAQKVYRRNRAALLVTAGFAFLLLTGFALVTGLWRAEIAARADADAARKEAEEHALKLQDDADRMNQASAAMDLGDMYVNFGLFFKAENQYSKAIQTRKDHISVWMHRAHFYARMGLWDLAAADAKEAYALHEPDSSNDWWHHALLMLESGDDRAYQNLCLRMRDRYSDSTDDFELGGLTAVWGLSAKAPPGYAEVIRITEERTSNGRTGEKGVRPYLLGIGYYRVGKYSDSVESLRKSLSDNQWEWNSISLPALAMALFKNNQPEEARRELANARAVLDQWTNLAVNSRNRFVPAQHWRDWLGMQRWYREAYQLIEGAPPPDDPRIKVLRERALKAIGRK